jgi:hypothetical protein
MNRNAPWGRDTPYEVSREITVDAMVSDPVALRTAYPVIPPLGTTLDYLGHCGGADALHAVGRHAGDRWLKMVVLNASAASWRHTGNSARRRPVCPGRPPRPLIGKTSAK